MLSLMLLHFTRRNFGQGRYIPFDGERIKVHHSVQLRMKDPEIKGYKPMANNWDVVKDSGMLEWVDQVGV